MSEALKLDTAKKVLVKLFGGFVPVISITLGSGLGYMTELLENARHCSYSKIPGCPIPGATGHAGELWWGELNGVNVVMQKGRAHLYEGYDVHEVVFLTRLLIMTGVKKMILTHATGSVTRNLMPGDIVGVHSQIPGECPDPTCGREIDKLGVMEFTPPDIAFNPAFLQIARECALQERVAFHRGVSIFKIGRTYEGRAEGDSMARNGADVATMSTAPEMIALGHMGAQGLDLALVTDMVANVRDEVTDVSHGEVLEVAERMKDPFGRLITAIVPEMAKFDITA